ncbi:hypothetical protein F4778DRAFT_714698 [Xylariomycetidae sp. FL2044]|nr:hypothetical protein F4778DRAFT_714698 [Xylariomycetidae sp. FL2044]
MSGRNRDNSPQPPRESLPQSKSAVGNLELPQWQRSSVLSNGIIEPKSNGVRPIGAVTKVPCAENLEALNKLQLTRASPLDGVQVRFPLEDVYRSRPKEVQDRVYLGRRFGYLYKLFDGTDERFQDLITKFFRVRGRRAGAAARADDHKEFFRNLRSREYLLWPVVANDGDKWVAVIAHLIKKDKPNPDALANPLDASIPQTIPSNDFNHVDEWCVVDPGRSQSAIQNVQTRFASILGADGITLNPTPRQPIWVPSVRDNFSSGIRVYALIKQLMDRITQSHCMEQPHGPSFWDPTDGWLNVDEVRGEMQGRAAQGCLRDMKYTSRIAIEAMGEEDTKLVPTVEVTAAPTPIVLKSLAPTPRRTRAEVPGQLDEQGRVRQSRGPQDSGSDGPPPGGADNDGDGPGSDGGDNDGDGPGPDVGDDGARRDDDTERRDEIGRRELDLAIKETLLAERERKLAEAEKAKDTDKTKRLQQQNDDCQKQVAQLQAQLADANAKTTGEKTKDTEGDSEETKRLREENKEWQIYVKDLQAQLADADSKLSAKKTKDAEGDPEETKRLQKQNEDCQKRVAQLQAQLNDANAKAIGVPKGGAKGAAADDWLKKYSREQIVVFYSRLLEQHQALYAAAEQKALEEFEEEYRGGKPYTPYTPGKPSTGGGKPSTTGGKTTKKDDDGRDDDDACKKEIARLQNENQSYLKSIEQLKRELEHERDECRKKLAELRAPTKQEEEDECRKKMARLQQDHDKCEERNARLQQQLEEVNALVDQDLEYIKKKKEKRESTRNKKANDEKAADPPPPAKTFTRFWTLTKEKAAAVPEEEFWTSTKEKAAAVPQEKEKKKAAAAAARSQDEAGAGAGPRDPLPSDSASASDGGSAGAGAKDKKKDKNVPAIVVVAAEEDDYEEEPRRKPGTLITDWHKAHPSEGGFKLPPLPFKLPPLPPSGDQQDSTTTTGGEPRRKPGTLITDYHKRLEGGPATTTKDSSHLVAPPVPYWVYGSSGSSDTTTKRAFDPKDAGKDGSEGKRPRR